MKAKEYLNEIAILNFKIKGLLEYIEDLEAKLTSIPSASNIQSDKVQSSIGVDYKVENLIDKISKKKEEVNKAIDIYVDRKDEAVKLVNLLKSENHIVILSLRHFDNKSWKEIAEEMNFTIRHVTRIHGYALLEFQKILNKNY